MSVRESWNRSIKELAMHPVRNDLPLETRQKVVEVLNQRLADLIDLRLCFHQAHWNVKGPQFYFLHELFGELLEQLDEPIDDLAERAVQLGGQAEGTLKIVGSRTILPEYPVGITRGLDHCHRLAEGVALVATRVRVDVDQTAEWGDALTADLFTGLGRLLDKQVWLLDTHLHG